MNARSIVSKALATYVIVDQNGTVLPIANQNFPGLPLRLARPVRITGQMTDDGIVVSRIEPPLVHVHIGHVMTAWRDTPGAVGLLTVAANDARVQQPTLCWHRSPKRSTRCRCMQVTCSMRSTPRSSRRDLHRATARRKSAAGGLQHVGFAASVEEASPAVKTHAGVVSAKLTDTIVTIDRAIATAQRGRAAAAQGEGLALTNELGSQISQIGEGIESAQQERA